MLMDTDSATNDHAAQSEERLHNSDADFQMMINGFCLISWNVKIDLLHQFMSL